VRKKIYINPTTSDENNHGIVNPYIDDLVKALGRYYQIVNKGKPSKTGIINFIKYYFKTDCYYFNWIEKLPTHKFGKFQSIIFILLISVFKLGGKKIIWTMHNKLSHTNDQLFLKKVLFKTMLKHSDVILTHSSEGILYGKQIYPASFDKMHYFPHPVKDRRINGKMEKKYDILIWGSLSPYKGTNKFLQFLYENGLENKYEILIIGKSTDPKYTRTLEEFANNKIRIENKFISNEELQKLIRQSKIVLFIYSSPSILGSGVLMDSLGFGANIIGPDVGAFADLAKENLLETFSGFNDLVRIIDHQISADKLEDQRLNINRFILENSWYKFAENISQIIESNIRH
jgi:glycosyltransferase involved in cell wall biosynthesis